MITISFCLFAIFSHADKVKDSVYKKISSNTVSVRIIKRHFDPDTGLPSIMMPPDEIFNKGIGFHIGKGNIITARHVINSIRSGDRSLFLDITTNTGEKIRKVKIGKCDAISNLKSPDICLLKTDFKGEGITLPREYALSALKNTTYGVLKIDSEGVPSKVIKSGKYLETVLMDKELGSKENNGLKLYEVSIQTIGGYSGSPIFNVQTGRLLGMTTTKLTVSSNPKDKDKKAVIKYENALVIPVKTIRKYLNSTNWKYEEIPRGWFY
jgi:hypothetical protein